MRKAIFLVSTLCVTLTSFGQTINLKEQLKSNHITVVNREIAAYETNAIELDAREGDGLAILKETSFKTGSATIEIKGENNPGKSFVGLAFNIQNDSTYEAVYFRPFNFVAEQPNRRSHMVQYIQHPTYTWHKLRNERTGEFEAELKTPPQPDNWFKATIAVTDTKVLVYLNDEEAPFLEVERLTKTTSDKIGLWTGFGSSGRFKNLVLSAKQ